MISLAIEQLRSEAQRNGRQVRRHAVNFSFRQRRQDSIFVPCGDTWSFCGRVHGSFRRKHPASGCAAEPALQRWAKMRMKM